MLTIDSFIISYTIYGSKLDLYERIFEFAFKRPSNYYSIINLDVNECSNNNGGCNRFCHNTFGSYYCTCNDNEQLDVDNHTCIGIEHHFCDSFIT